MDEFGGQQRLACAKASHGDSLRQKTVTSHPPLGESFWSLLKPVGSLLESSRINEIFPPAPW